MDLRHDESLLQTCISLDGNQCCRYSFEGAHGVETVLGS